MAETNSVVLVSNDNFQFVVRKSAATVSPAIKSMLDKRSMGFLFLLFLSALLTKSLGYR